MTTTTINPSNIRTIQGVGIETPSLKMVERFVGMEPNCPLRTRGASTYASPDFRMYIHNDDASAGEDEAYRYNDASVVVNRMPELLVQLAFGRPIATGTPVALGMTLLDDEEWYMLFRYRREGFSHALTCDEVLVRYDGEPEDLMQMSEIFELNESEKDWEGWDNQDD